MKSILSRRLLLSSEPCLLYIIWPWSNLMMKRLMKKWWRGWWRWIFRTHPQHAGKQMKIKKQHQHFLYEFFALSRFNKSFEYADELTMLSSWRQILWCFHWRSQKLPNMSMMISTITNGVQGSSPNLLLHSNLIFPVIIFVIIYRQTRAY